MARTPALHLRSLLAVSDRKTPFMAAGGAAAEHNDSYSSDLSPLIGPGNGPVSISVTTSGSLAPPWSSTSAATCSLTVLTRRRGTLRCVFSPPKAWPFSRRSTCPPVAAWAASICTWTRTIVSSRELVITICSASRTARIPTAIGTADCEQLGPKPRRHWPLRIEQLPLSGERDTGLGRQDRVFHKHVGMVPDKYQTMV